MKQILTPGRWRGLKTTSTRDDIFTILAFDQRGSYRKMLSEGSSYETAVRIKTDVVVSLSYHASAVLLDHEYGLYPALHMSGGSGLLLSVEKSGYSGDSTYRRIDFIDDWDVSKIKAMGASAVKMMAYYHPETGALAEEIEQVIAKVIAACHQLDIPLFLEPMSYSLDPNVAKESADFAKTRLHVVRETARRLGGLKPDVLKMEFPVDVAYDKDRGSWRSACASLNAVCEVPWVLLSAGVDFATFEEQTRIACESGASGFLAGRAIWKEAVTMSDEARARFLAETAVPRIKKLADVASKTARPWTEFYELAAASADWYKSYQPTL
ncbi:MAG: tagatose 1,6-diphosphate aldolase [Anaerolineae bacterium]